MKLEWAGATYTTSIAADNGEGWIAVKLVKQMYGKEERIARITFWDAEGQFYLEAPAGEVPLAAIEMLISEAKRSIAIV